MNELKDKNTITSLELLEQLNFFREKEYEFKSKNNTLTKAESKRGKFVKLEHKDLLKIINDEFIEEINEGKISPVEYIDKKGENRPMFVITLNQAKQLLARESKFVRKAIIEYIEKLENKLEEKQEINLNNLDLENVNFENLSSNLLISLSNVIKKNEKLKKENKKLLIYEEYTEIDEKSNVLYTTTQIANSIGTTARNLNIILEKYGFIKNIRIITHNNKANSYWELTDKYKYLEYAIQKFVGEGELNVPYLKWTAKGKHKIINILNELKLLDKNKNLENKNEKEQKLLEKHEHKQEKIDTYYKKKLLI